MYFCHGQWGCLLVASELSRPVGVCQQSKLFLLKSDFCRNYKMFHSPSLIRPQQNYIQSYALKRIFKDTVNGDKKEGLMVIFLVGGAHGPTSDERCWSSKLLSYLIHTLEYLIKVTYVLCRYTSHDFHSSCHTQFGLYILVKVHIFLDNSWHFFYICGYYSWSL